MFKKIQVLKMEIQNNLPCCDPSTQTVAQPAQPAPDSDPILDWATQRPGNLAPAEDTQLPRIFAGARVASIGNWTEPSS